MTTRERLIQIVVNREIAIVRAQENADRNVAARGGWENVTEAERKSFEYAMRGLVGRKEFAEKVLARYDASHGEGDRR